MNDLLRFLPTELRVVAGYSHTVAVNGTGDFYAWGRNMYGQLGIGNRVNQLVPVKVQLPGSMRMIVAGGSSTFAVFDTGNVYAWGSNGTGRLGTGNQVDQLVPIKIQLPEPISMITAGRLH